MRNATGAASVSSSARQGCLITPDISRGIHEGSIRESLVTLADEEIMAVETEARAQDRTELDVADEIFLCCTAA